MINSLDRLAQLAGIETLTESKSVHELSADQLKDAISAAKEKQRTMSKDSSLYNDTQKQIERYEAALKSKSTNEAHDLNEADAELLKLTNPPVSIQDLKDGKANDDTLKMNDERSGMDELKNEKIEVPSSVKKSIKTRMAELKSSMETFGGGGPKETAIEQLEKISELLSSGNLLDYREAQILYGTLWNEITELFPTALVSFLHTGKELEKTTVQ